MTVTTENILILPLYHLNNASSRTIVSLTEIINIGYSKANQYGLILNLRIKSSDVFFKDLGFSKNQDKSVLYLYVDDKAIDDSSVSENFSKIEVPGSEANTNYYLPDLSKQLDCVFQLEHTKATIGFKPYKGENTYELTSYSSFGRGNGSKGFDKTLPHLKHSLKCETLIAECFVPHNLVGYYEKKLGFKEIDRNWILKDKLASYGFEEGFECTRDFEIATLTRPLDM